MFYRYLIILAFTVIFFSPVRAQDANVKPFVFPVAAPPSPSTWLLGQLYGNTTGAFNNADRWYSAGQGLHFGIDISMPCRTELVAVADGEVMFVDDMGFGSAPHNLILRHPAQGLTTLYGHLYERPAVVPGQIVQKGEVVALSGDPDIVCDSRPHLHFEVRSLDYFTTYNPVDYIDAPWHTLAMIGSFSNAFFQQDLDNPRQWVSLDDQPPVSFGGRRLNDYAQSWPLSGGLQAPTNLILRREPLPIPETMTLRALGYDGCCSRPWWHPTDPTHLSVIDGVPGERANIFDWTISGSLTMVAQAPPPYLSPDGSHQVIFNNGQVSIRRLADGAEWIVQTQGEIPAISADNSRLTWDISGDKVAPGQQDGTIEFWISDISGENTRLFLSQIGGSIFWLDDARILISTPQIGSRATTYSVYDTRDNSVYTLGTWEWIRGLSISPGGERLMFYRVWQPDPADNVIYTIATEHGATAEKMPWFGGWRWRDADSVYFVPFDPSTDVQRLAYYHIPTGETRFLTDPAATPFTIADGDWSVSADGRRIVFLNAGDKTMWLIEEGD